MPSASLTLYEQRLVDSVGALVTHALIARHWRLRQVALRLIEARLPHLDDFHGKGGEGRLGSEHDVLLGRLELFKVLCVLLSDKRHGQLYHSHPEPFLAAAHLSLTLFSDDTEGKSWAQAVRSLSENERTGWNEAVRLGAVGVIQVRFCGSRTA